MIILDPNNVLNGLIYMSIVGFILQIAIIILVYPTLKERSKKSSHK